PGGQKLCVKSLLPIGPARREAVLMMSEEHLLGADVGCSLVRIANHDRHDTEETTDLFNLMLASFQRLSVNTRHLGIHPLSRPIQNQGLACVLRSRVMLVNPIRKRPVLVII